MAQAFIDHVLHNDKELGNQIQELRRNNEFSDCDEHLLIQAADEIEEAYKKRKRRDDECEKPNKKFKVGFMCDFCDRMYKHKRTLNRHIQSHFMKFECKTCEKSFTQNSSLNRHKAKCENSTLTKCSATGRKDTAKQKGHTCKHCGIPFNDYDSLFQHVTDTHPLNQSGGNAAQRSTHIDAGTVKENDKRRFRFKKSAMNNTAQQTSIFPHGNEKYDLLQFLANVKEDVENELQLQKAKQRSIKWYVNARVEMIRDIEGENKEKAHPHFRSKNYISLQTENNDHNLNEPFQAVNRALEEFINKGSNWVLNKIICLEVHTVLYSPIAGSSYMELPRKIRHTHGVVNILNQDQRCFLWSVLAALHPVQSHPERISHYTQYENELNMKDIDYPVSLSKVEKFEKQNEISVNVFGYEEGEIYPLYLSKLESGHREVDLLYLSDGEHSHYCWIKNLDHFLGSTTRFHTRRFYCRRCLHGFVRRDLLQKHRTYCDKFDFQKVEYPKKGKDILSFQNHEKRIPVPMVIYADFECYSLPIDTCSPDPNKPSTTPQTKFEACGYSYVVVSTNEKYTKPAVVYRGDDVVKHFFEDMMKEETYINEKLSHIEPLIMNEKTERDFENATNCYVCNRLFNDKLIKVRDHDHLGVNGDIESSNYSNFRGAACQGCNLNLQHPNFIPVYFHNMSNFDAHLLLSEAGKYKDKKLSVIAQNTERYISFSLGKLRFLDSYKCMDSSLETLVNNLKADGLINFKQFRKAFPSDEALELLLQKNEYCYDYVDCAEKFEEPNLPRKEAFYNRLSKEPISDERYQHAVKVWEFFDMKTLGEFHDLYVLTDTLLLCDVFQKFREMCLKNYGLDPCHFYTSPGLAWQAALKMSGIHLELLSDPFMYSMFEIGTRGGVSMVSRKHSKANHHLLNDFDRNKPSKHIMYLDANNLYGWAMSQLLPTGLMRFLTQEEMNNFDLQQIPENSNVGYVLEVDLEYPPEIHDLHNCYPLAPEHKLMDDDQLSPYSNILWENLNGEKIKRVKTKKLVPTLENKSNYIVHYRNLQLYQELGMKVTKIHKVLEFHQSAWLKTYIDFNANMRKNAKNDFEKDFFKLMCNSVFGKCLENIRSRINFHLVNTPERLRKYVSKPSFDRFQIFNEDLIGVVNKQVNLVLNKPIYVGQAILDLSKKLMYDFHYKVMKPMYGDKINLLFTDTDSLCYEIQTEDVYQDMRVIHNYFDTSNYPDTHFLYSTDRKKIPGFFKDENSSVPIKEFLGLRPKMYSISYDVELKENDNNGKKRYKQEEKKVAKGIAKSEIRKNLRHEHYKKSLFKEVVTMNSANMIRSRNHLLYVDSIVKKGLCSFDDKRYWRNPIESYAFGHYEIK